MIASDKRSVMNMNFAGVTEYAFIDHVRGGIQFGPGTSSTWWTPGDPLWTQNIDSDGWPAYSTAVINKIASLGAIRIPASADFAGPYTIDGFGSGVITLASGTWTLGAATGVTKASNNLTVTDQGPGVRWTAQLTYSGSRADVGLNCGTVDPLNTGKFIRQVRFYRTEDAADLVAGMVFRTPWKQIYADLNPGFIRFMNWYGDNSARLCRFENRAQPSHTGSVGRYNWATGPRYGETTGTNQFALAAVTGTPSSMQHGEVAQTRITNALVRSPAYVSGGSVNKTITAITKANPGVVTCTGHGFNTGDKIIHLTSAGMTELDRRVCTITVSDANTYSLGIDTSAFSTFTAGSCNQYISLQVGSGNDRRDYPVVFDDGYTPANLFGHEYLAAGDGKTFYFDKTIYAAKDSDGTIIQGVWIFGGNGKDVGHKPGIPLEVCVACVNEINELSSSPVGMWLNIPHGALLSVDPDYSAGSNTAVNSIDVVINGANGYDGLGASLPLVIEYSNETWNSANLDFAQTMYLTQKGVQRWGLGLTSVTDRSSYAPLRSYLMCKDIQAAFPRVSYPRIKYVMGFHGSQGIASGVNYNRTHGTTAMLTDAWNPNGDTPMSVHDYAAFAAYIYNDDSNATYSKATCTTTWLAAGTDEVAKEAACATYVLGMKTHGGSQTFDAYYDTLMPAYATAMGALSKKILMYEGGWDLAITGTADQQNFLAAAKRSRAFANTLISSFNKFNANADALYPADYIALDARWGHASGDFYSGGIEGGNLDLSWTLMGFRNRGLRQMVVTT
jgi:hypothetical protein